jgi:hypothetical protein
MYDAEDDEEKAEIVAKWRRSERYGRGLSSALKQNPALKEELEALSEEGQCVAGAALVAEKNHPRGLLAAAKQAPGSSEVSGCFRTYLQRILEGENQTSRQLPLRATPPCPPLRPAHCIPTLLQTALRLRTELYCCEGGKRTTQKAEAAEMYDAVARHLPGQRRAATIRWTPTPHPWHCPRVC